MKLNHLKLYHFKNHEQGSYVLKNKVLGIHGLNGAGKTNVLDAIYFLCVGKSYFSSTDSHCIHNDFKEASLIAEMETDEPIELKLKMKRGARKTIERNGKKYPKILDHVGHYFAVVIAPGDISMIYGDNKDRRRFIDQIISQTDQHYLHALVAYNKLIEQRNRHLKSDWVDQVLLDALDEQIGPLLVQIHDKRSQFLPLFIESVQEFYSKLSKDKEKVSIDHESQMYESAYLELITKHAQKDRILRRSTVGIHKDEILFTLNDLPLKKFGSQGQIKSYLIALKLAEYEYYKMKMGVTPILLLDDIFEKIDDERALALTDIIKSGNFGQIFVTDTQEKRLKAFCEEIDQNHQLIEI